MALYVIDATGESRLAGRGRWGRPTPHKALQILIDPIPEGFNKSALADLSKKLRHP